MAVWTLTVRSTYLTSQHEVWRYKTDPESLAAELGPWLQMTVTDPDALARALRGAAPASFRARVTGPLGLVGLPWPMDIVRSEPELVYQDTSVNALYRRFQHTHRAIPAAAGRVKYVDEVVFEPRLRPSVLTARLTRALFLHRHERAAQDLPLDAVEGTRSWLATKGPYARPFSATFAT